MCQKSKKRIGLRGFVAKTRTPNPKWPSRPLSGLGFEVMLQNHETQTPNWHPGRLGFEVSVQNPEPQAQMLTRGVLGFEVSLQNREPRTHTPTLSVWASRCRCKIANPRLEFSPCGSGLPVCVAKSRTPGPHAYQGGVGFEVSAQDREPQTQTPPLGAGLRDFGTKS